MHYITRQAALGKEKLIAVVGEIRDAGEFRGELHIRSVNELFDNNVEIPLELKWIVESDRKHQERELESRFGNITGENALTL